MGIVVENTINGSLMSLISIGIKMLLKFKKFKIRHMYQKTNMVTGLLAKKATKIEEQFVTLFDYALNVLPIIIT